MDSSGNLVWVKSFGGTNGSYASGKGIAIDTLGNVFTAGNYFNQIDFNPGMGTAYLTGYDEIFISKLNASGNYVWAKRLGGLDTDLLYGLSLDSLGNVYTIGNFQGTFGIVNSAGGNDIFISKLNASGNFVWLKSMGGTSEDLATGIAVDASGNVYAAGVFSGISDFNPSAETTTLTSAGGSDVFVSKLDASGNFVWAKSMGGTNEDLSIGIGIDASGNVYTSGNFKQTCDFDPSAGVANLTSAGLEDIFIQKLSQNTTTGTQIINGLSSKILVYPNPTDGKIYLSFEETLSTASVIVRNYLGQELLRKPFTDTNLLEFSIDAEAGIYFVEVWDGYRKAVVKVVKR